VRIEADRSAPLGCRIAACRNAWTDATRDGRVMQLNGSADVVRISTSNGPISIGPAKDKLAI
jgi:hypothetical protein